MVMAMMVMMMIADFLYKQQLAGLELIDMVRGFCSIQAIVKTLAGYKTTEGVSRWCRWHYQDILNQNIPHIIDWS